MKSSVAVIFNETKNKIEIGIGRAHYTLNEFLKTTGEHDEPIWVKVLRESEKIALLKILTNSL